MAVTEERVQTIEKSILDIQEQINDLVSKIQFNQAFLIHDNEINEIKTRLDNIESQIRLLQNE